MGMTYIHLKEADESIMTGALKTAYTNIKEKQSQRKSSKKPAKSAKSSTPAKNTRRPLQ
jgi:hypothetical protein